MIRTTIAPRTGKGEEALDRFEGKERKRRKKSD